MEKLIKEYLEAHINRWYRIAKEDYGITGRFIDVKITQKPDGRNVEIYFEEDGRKYRTTIWMANEDSIEFVYNVWMEDAEFERIH